MEQQYLNAINKGMLETWRYVYVERKKRKKRRAQNLSAAEIGGVGYVISSDEYGAGSRADVYSVLLVDVWEGIYSVVVNIMFLFDLRC